MVIYQSTDRTTKGAVSMTFQHHVTRQCLTDKGRTRWMPIRNYECLKTSPKQVSACTKQNLFRFTPISQFTSQRSLSSDYTESNDWTINEYWVVKNIEQSGRALIQRTIRTFTWRDWDKTRKSSVTIAGLWTEISNRDFPNKK